MNPVSYIQSTISELKQVRWPNRETTVKLTLIVIVISTIVAIYIGALDFLFTNLLTLINK